MLARIALVAICAFGCQSIKELGGGAGLDLTFIGLGQVFQCDVADGTQLELCYDGEQSELLDSLQASDVPATVCRSTPRHLGPCVYCCDDDCGRGANAFNGAWCE